MNSIIEVSENGFIITSFSKKRLAYVGGLFLLRSGGYTNHRSIKECIDKNPQKLQNCVRGALTQYIEKILNSNYRNTVSGTNKSIMIYLVKNLLSVHEEYILYINLDIKKDNFYKFKKILWTIHDMTISI